MLDGIIKRAGVLPLLLFMRIDMVSGRNRRLRDIQRDLRPDQGGDILSEFFLEVVWPLATFIVFLLLCFLVMFL